MTIEALADGDAREVRLIHAGPHAQVLGIGHARDHLSGRHGLAGLARQAVGDALERGGHGERGHAALQLPRGFFGELEAGAAGARSGQRIETRLRHAQPFDGLAVGELVGLVGRARESRTP